MDSETDREPHAEDYIPDPEDEREVPIDDEAELELPPPTLDPEERIEAPREDEINDPDPQ